MSMPPTTLSNISPPTLPSSMIIIAADVHADLNAATYLSPTTNVIVGHLRNSPARLIEKRQLSYHSQAGISVRHMLVAQAALRHSHESPRHVPVAGVHQHGSRTFIVEAPYHYTELEDYLAATPTADRMSLTQQAVKIIADLHSRGLVHGSIMANAFVVDQQGNLYLSQFDNMRVEDPNAPFFPMNNPSAGAMAFMAPELLQSMRDDGVASLSRATDVYALGCLGYELLTGTDPFSRYTHCATKLMAQAWLITAVVDRRERPERRGVGTGVWNVLEACWAHAPTSRPTAPVLLQNLATVI